MDAPLDSKQQKGLVREEKLSYHASRLKASPRMPDHCRKIFVWEFFNETKEVGRVYSWLGDDDRSRRLR
jgi:hypothetical protein